MTQYKYSNDWIYKLEPLEHWSLYWHQQHLMDNNIQKDVKIVEVGVGTKFTYHNLKNQGYDVTSIDIDPAKQADINLNIVDCTPENLNYDVLLAYNIFEHIPYNEFLDTVSKISRSNITKLFFSIPLNRKHIFGLKLRLGRFIDTEYDIMIKKRRITAENHFWELDYKNYTLDKLILDMEHRGFSCNNTFKHKTQSYFYFSKVE